jgi:hypothetical protein
MMPIIDMLISVSIATCMLAGVLWATQRWLSRTRIPSDHPVTKIEVEKLAPSEVEAAHMLLPPPLAKDLSSPPIDRLGVEIQERARKVEAAGLQLRPPNT